VAAVLHAVAVYWKSAAGGGRFHVKGWSLILAAADVWKKEG
jgi:hypothetical protein